MWVQPDVLGLFSESVGSFSSIVGLSASIFSRIVGSILRCYRAEPFIFSGRYNYYTARDNEELGAPSRNGGEWEGKGPRLRGMTCDMRRHARKCDEVEGSGTP
jgi:hypothetical protein